MNQTFNEVGATFAFGIITAVDAARGWARARLPEYDNLETAWLPVLQSRTHQDKALDLFDVGEQVALILDLRGEDGVILGAIWSKADAVPDAGGPDVDARLYADGTRVCYDRKAHKLTADVRGDIEIRCSGQARVTADGPAHLESQAALTLAAPAINLQGAISMNNYSGSGPTTAALTGSLTVQSGGISVPDNDVTAKGISLAEHRHTGVDTGGGESGGPV